jgi:DNA-binding winged helix-turn-helix (wHTH) protein/TolB-like protein
VVEPGSTHRVYSFGEFTLDVDRAMLARADDEIRLRPKSFAVLCYLIEHHRRLVTKEELLRAIWGHTAVTDGALTQCLIDIRRAVGDTSQRMIRTVPRRGYVFDMTVTTLDSTGEESPQPLAEIGPPRDSNYRWLRWVVPVVVAAVVALAVPRWWQRGAEEPSAPPLSSIAVLPLKGIGLPADSEWLTHGIAIELTGMLATIPNLTVASQAEAFAHADRSVVAAGREMGVDGLLLGSLHVAPDGLEVKMELVRSSDGKVVWREAFRSSMDDPLALQRALAGRAFNYFGQSVSDYGLMQPETTAAQAANLKRLAQWLTGNTAEERRWAEMTVALEPTFAMGHVNLVWPYFFAALDDPYGPWKSKAREALDAAAQLGISHTPPYQAHQGLYQWVFERNLDGAEQLLREAFVAGDSYGRIYYLRLIMSSGIHGPTCRLLKHLTMSEPQASLHWELLARCLGYSGDYASAIEALERTLTLTGEDDYFAIEHLVLAHLARGDVSAARSAMERLQRTSVPDWRLKSLEAWLHSRAAPGTTDPVEVVMSLDAERPHWPGALLLLSSGDVRAEQVLADRLADVLASPRWGKHWIDEVEWAMSPADRGSPIWKTFRNGLGYTDEWLLELCRRMATLPPESHLYCDLQEFEQGP